MLRRLFLREGFAIGVVGYAAVLQAQSSDGNVAATGPPRALSVEIMLGHNAPAGDLAVGLVVDLSRHLSVAGAAGLDPRGEYFRAALSSRLRLHLIGPLSGDVSLGFSYGTQTDRGDGLTTSEGTQWSLSKTWRPQFRADPELGLSYRPFSRLALRAFAGVGLPLNRPSCRYFSKGTVNLSETSCDSSEIPEGLRSRYQVFPYAGAAVSVAAVPLGADEQSWGSLKRPDRWYGWQILPVDAAALAVAAFGYGHRTLVFPAGFVVLTAAPAVHLLHDNPQRALASLAMRVAMAYVGTLAGGAAGAEPHSDRLSAGGAAVGMLVAMGLASLVDDLLLAWD